MSNKNCNISVIIVASSQEDPLNYCEIIFGDLAQSSDADETIKCSRLYHESHKLKVICNLLFDLFSLGEIGIIWNAVTWMTSTVFLFLNTVLFASGIFLSASLFPSYECSLPDSLCLSSDHWAEQTRVSHRDLLEPLGAEGHLNIRPGKAMKSHTAVAK